jgi:hypothetical protein
MGTCDQGNMHVCESAIVYVCVHLYCSADKTFNTHLLIDCFSVNVDFTSPNIEHDISLQLYFQLGINEMLIQIHPTTKIATLLF